jgi:hypothetical protein
MLVHGNEMHAVRAEGKGQPFSLPALGKSRRWSRRLMSLLGVPNNGTEAVLSRAPCRLVRRLRLARTSRRGSRRCSSTHRR